MLKIIDDVDSVGFGFRPSAPTKIAGSKSWAFSLPAGPDFTCPGATEACVDCYASKGRHHFSNVQTAFARNWLTFSFFESRNDIPGVVDALLNMIPAAATIFRIHESGDFANQFAVDAWTEVAKLKPATNFWFYTRSFNLDFTKLVKLTNVSGFASTDEYNKDAANSFAKRFNIKQAFGPWDKEVQIPQGSYVCPATNGKIAIEAACLRCQLCVDKNKTNKHVVFMSH